VTATATRPAPPATPPPASAPSTPAGPRPPASRAPHFLVPAEIGLFALTIAVVYGFTRVFTSAEFVIPMLAVAIVGHLITMVCRRRGYGLLVTALIAVPGFLLVLTWALFFSATFAGVPTVSTLHAAGDALTASWEAFPNVTAPTTPLAGFVMAACLALFFVVFLADWAAFRLWSTIEAVIPATTVFIFCSVLGSIVHRIDAVAVFLCGLLGFVLLHRIARQETSAGWLTADIRRGSNAALVVGAGLAVTAIIAGVVIGPRLPGTNSPSIIDWRGTGGGAGSRVTLSPLVDIQDRLVSKSAVEVFTVSSNVRANWRMTSLDIFKGDIWSSTGKYSGADGPLNSSLPAAVGTHSAQQVFNIENLKALWLPAAFKPVSVESVVDVRYQSDSDTLIVDQSDSDGLTYTVQSSLPVYDPAKLQAANGKPPDDIASRYLALPDNFSQKARDEAIKHTQGAKSPFDRALMLTNWFRTDFTYDLSVPKGHGESAIEKFLSDDPVYGHRGYCEQFAGTYAAMARSLGIPSRVAVGFTTGDADASQPNLFHVYGANAHAWPEVYLGDNGWVAFDPTPGRGLPGAENYTGVPEQQAEAQATTGTTPGGTVPGSGTTLLAAPPTSEIPPELLTSGPDEAPVAETSAWDTPVQAARVSGVSLTLVAVLFGAYALLVISIKSSRRRQRRSGAENPSAQVFVAWRESIEALEILGITHHPTETHEEFAQRARPRLDAAGDAFVGLAHDMDAAAYAPEILTEDVARRAEQASLLVIKLVREKTETRRQWYSLLDPRPVLPDLHLANRRRAASRSIPNRRFGIE
jgi:transglutaminase-like putative cysteine protease